MLNFASHNYYLYNISYITILGFNIADICSRKLLNVLVGERISRFVVLWGHVPDS
jgi:hypothetical protein